MIRQLIITCLIVLCTTNSRAQDMAAVFTAMPDQYIPQLEHAWRKDLVDLYKEGKEARLKNTMNGFSALRKLTADYLLLETTERSTVEMKLLPLVNKTYIVCMIATVKGPAPDSRIHFYTTEWEPLSTTDLLATPKADWYLRTKDAAPNDEARREAIARLDMDLVEYTLNPDTPTLTMTYTTPLYLSAEERTRIQPHLSDPIVYTWKGYRFE